METKPSRTTSSDGSLKVDDRVIDARRPSWAAPRGGRIFKFSQAGGLAFVEWDDKLGPQVVAVGDVRKEPK